MGALILFGLTIAGITSLVKSAQKSTPAVVINDDAILMLDLRNTVHEQGETSSIPFIEDKDDVSAGLYNLTQMLQEAADDDRVAGILIRTGGTPSSWGTLQSIRNAVLQFKKSGKPVWAYGEDISQRDYFVASAADSVFLNPVGDFQLTGLASQLQFYKGTLDKLGVQPEIFYAGRFKSATEPFREYKMTDANRQQVSVILNGIWAEYLEAAAAHAGVDTATVGAWTQTGAVLFPEDALARRLIDKVAYWDEVEAILKAKTDVDSGDKLKLTHPERVRCGPGEEHFRK